MTVWLPWTNIDGTKTEIAFLHLPNGRKKVIQRQITDHNMLNAIFDANEAQANGTHIRNAVRGNTQKHRVPVARIPTAIYWRWRRELGNPHVDPTAAKRWKQRLNDHNYRFFRTAEGHI